MKRNEVIKKIKAEAKENLPDNYDRILSAARAEGLLIEDAGEVYGGGEAVRAKRNNKALVGILSAVCALVLAAIVAAGKTHSPLSTSASTVTLE